MNYIVLTLIITKFLSLFLGMTIAYLSYRIGKRYDNQFMLTLSIGFTLISIGSFIELVLIGLNLDINLVHLLESLVLIVGLGIIAYTLILRK